MLFVTLLKSRASTSMERIARRLEWQYPEGVRVVAEYWLQTPDPSVVAVTEADSIGPIMAATAPWEDVFDITVIPAVTAEEGMAIARQAMSK